MIALSCRCLKVIKVIPTGVESELHIGAYSGITILTK